MTSPQQPPASGPGSGVAAWRDYAVAVTGESKNAFDDMSRDEIVEYLETEGPVEDMTGTEGLAEANDPANAPESAPATGGWMTPTNKGWEQE